MRPFSVVAALLLATASAAQTPKLEIQTKQGNYYWARRLAPSATRIPISGVRRATDQAITPYRAVAARNEGDDTEAGHHQHERGIGSVDLVYRHIGQGRGASLIDEYFPSRAIPTASTVRPKNLSCPPNAGRPAHE